MHPMDTLTQFKFRPLFPSKINFKVELLRAGDANPFVAQMWCRAIKRVRRRRPTSRTNWPFSLLYGGF
jgi:hypothetical protein